MQEIFWRKNRLQLYNLLYLNEGTYFRYDTMTNEFGIINEYGGISTYFKPENGIVYWLEQIEKYAPK